MAETFFVVGNGNPRAVTAIRRKADGTTQTLDQAVPDGDTVGVQLDGTGSTRFLGIDTPEKAFEQPLGGGTALDGPKWEQYLTNPFGNGFPVQLLEPPLLAHLQARFGSGAAANHHRHAVAAGDALRQLIQSDQVAMGQTPEQFRYFVAFGYEVFDRYGRFLAFINRNQPDAAVPAPRPPSYNERQLAAGRALPYFIWPNIDPFRDAPTVVDAVPPPGTARQLAESGDLKKARSAIKQARANGLGVFDPAESAALPGLRGAFPRPRRGARPRGDRPEQGRHRHPSSAELLQNPEPGGPLVHPRRVRAAVRGQGLAAGGLRLANDDSGVVSGSRPLRSRCRSRGHGVRARQSTPTPARSRRRRPTVVPSGGICDDGRRERIRTNSALRSGAPGFTATVVPGVLCGRSQLVVRATSAAIA